MTKTILFAILMFPSVSAFASTGFVPHPDGSVTAPDGLRWLPPVRNQDGSLVMLPQKQAVKCCNAGPRLAGYPPACPFGAQGQRLPTRAEFETLGKQLGYGTPAGYNPSVIPNLTDVWYWSAGGPGSPVNTYVFWSDEGYTANWDWLQGMGVRCVSR